MKFDNIEDESLVVAILRGDKLAYAKLVNKYQDFAFNLSMKFSGNNRELSEEITQDAFMKVYKSLNSFKNGSKFSTWLYRIVFTTAMSEVRKKNILSYPDDFEKETINLEASSEWDTYAGDSNFILDKLKEAMAKLPKMEALIVELYYMNEQNIEEISSIVGLNENLIKVKLFRSRKKIKQFLDPKITEL